MIGNCWLRLPDFFVTALCAARLLLLLSVLLSLLLPAAAGYAGDTDLAMRGDSASGRAPAGGSSELWVVAVLDFEAIDVPAELARAAADSLAACLRRGGEFHVLVGDGMRVALEDAAGSPEPRRVCNEATCAVAAGEKIGANSVVIGEVTLIGKMLSVSIRIFNVYTGEVSGTWKAESFDGAHGLPAAARHLADQIVAAKRTLLRGGRPTPEMIREEEAAAAAQIEAIFTLGVGFGLWGQSDTRVTCDVSDTGSVCTEGTADLKWLVNIGMYGRSKNSNLTFGLRGGGTWVETTRQVTYHDPLNQFTEGSEDKGLHFYLCPVVGYILTESNNGNIMAFAGAGYRNLTADSGVSSTFAILGLAVQISRLNAEAVYQRGLESGTLLQDMVTVGIGFGTGF